MVDERPMLTVDQVGQRLQVSPWTVRKWLREGKLGGVNFGGQVGWRISETDVQKLLATPKGE